MPTRGMLETVTRVIFLMPVVCSGMVQMLLFKNRLSINKVTLQATNYNLGAKTRSLFKLKRNKHSLDLKTTKLLNCIIPLLCIK